MPESDRAERASEDAVEACPHLHMEERHYYVSRFSTEMASAWWCHDCERYVQRRTTPPRGGPMTTDSPGDAPEGE